MLEKPQNPEYYGEYVLYGLHTLFWIVTAPVGIPLAFFGYCAYRFNHRMAEKMVEHKRKQRQK